MSSFARINDHRVLHANDPARTLDGKRPPLIIARNRDHHIPSCAGDAAAFADRATGCQEETSARTVGGIVYKSEAIRSVLAQVHQVAPMNTTVLLLGETGVGKEMFAQALHDASPRRHRPMIRVSCAALPATLIESELFGHERGAFTDAVSRRIGRFEAANGSTLFLDEVGELSLESQVKLLRVLEARTIDRLGGRGSITIDVRIIAATNRDLEEAMRRGAFREDLFYRLNVFPITIPPLRERKEDISALAWAFVEELSARFGKTVDGISSRSLVQLQRYPWPGNVRELRNVIEREMIVADGPTLAPTVQPMRTGGERLADAHARMTGHVPRARRPVDALRDVRSPDPTFEMRGDER